MSGTVNHSVRVLHDRVTLVAYASMASWAWFGFGLGAAIVFLRQERDVSAWVLGLHGTFFAIGGIVGSLLTPRLVRRYGRGVAMRIGVLGAAFSIAAFLIPLPAVAWTIAMVFFASAFGNVVAVSVNAFIAAHQGAGAPAALTENTALSALAGLLAPITAGILALTAFGWRAGMFVAVVGLVVVELFRGRNLEEYGYSVPVRSAATSTKLPRLTYWALGAATADIGAEFCLSLWAATLLRERTGMSAAAAAAGFGAYLGGIFVGRAFGSGLARRFSPERLLQCSLVAGFAMFVLLWIANVPWTMLAGLAATGIALSLAWPLNMSRIIRSAEGNNDRAASYALAFTTAAVGAAPFLLGTLSESVGIHSAFLVVPVLITTSLVLVLIRPVAPAVAFVNSHLGSPEKSADAT